MTLTFGSLFSGIGGFDLGFERAGMECLFQVEIDEKCQGVLSRHWPNVEKHRNVKEVSKDNLRSVDVICGGFPCQDLSVAGKRAGLAGSRSGLWYEFHRILAELRPQWVVIENVPGLLSSNGGRDFAAVLSGLADIGYLSAWRVLDAQYFGVAQRRRRVFVVASLGDGRAAEVLFEREGGAGDTPPGREAGQGFTANAPRGFSTSGAGWWKENEIKPLGARDWKDGGPGLVAFGGNRTSGPIDTATACNAHGGTGRMDFESETFIAIRPAQTGSNGWGVFQDGTTHTLDGTGGDVIAFSSKDSGADAGELAPTLRSMNYAESHINGGGQVAVAMSLYENQEGRVWLSDTANLQGTGGKPGQGYPAALTSMGVRRLTPTECERLQGFPDGWTETGYVHPSPEYIAECARKGEVPSAYVVQRMSDSTRYRQLGNAVCVNVAEWIGKRIMEIENG
jgi:DNA (cytosine-5)-methyltransferase 1